jgi:prophage tail gpP-like protein
MTVPNPSEVATVVVDSLQFSTWESVMVQHRFLESFPIFAVEVSEPTPGPTSFAAIRFNVGDVVTVYLAGIQAISGIITTRQSGADAERHGVQFIGKGRSWQMAKSSVPLPLGNFDGQTYLQIATSICAAFGVGVKVIGALDMTPFPQLQAVPGTPAFDFLETNARSREVILGSDEFGNLLLIGSYIPNAPTDTLIEGGANRNIERINVVFNNDTLFADYLAVGQNVGSNTSWGTAAAQIAATLPGADPHASVLIVPTEEPGSAANLQRRLMFEARTHDATQLTATITVPGWLRGNGDLWRVGLLYNIIAPDHFPGFDNGIQLAAKTCTFEQNEVSGTITTIEFCFPWLLGGELLQPGLPSAPADVKQINP